MRFIIFLSVIFFVSAAVQGIPCPFNPQECSCIDDQDGDGNTFSHAECTSTSLPTFNGSSSSNYTILGQLSLMGDFSCIPADHFSVFGFIQTLSISQVGQSPVAQWDRLAFAEVKIETLMISGVSGLLPVDQVGVPWTFEIGRAGLTELSISGCETPMAIDKPAVSNLIAVKTLKIIDSPVAAFNYDVDKIDFYALENLALRNASLKEFVIPKNTPTIIQRLNLDNNGALMLGGLSEWFVLRELSLKGNALSKTLDAGGLDNLPAVITKLYLDYGDFASVPGRILSKINFSGVLLMSLGNNKIQKIQNGDIPEGGKNVDTLILRGNPISQIDNKALENLKRLTKLDLSNTRLTAVDFTILNGVSVYRNHLDVILDDNAFLSKILASDISQLQDLGPLRISIKNTGLTTIDTSIRKLLDNRLLQITIDLSNNVHLVCEKLNWITVYVYCAKSVKIDGATCADYTGESLDSYLLRFRPNPCAIPTVPPSTSTSKRPSTEPSGKGWKLTVDFVTFLCGCLMSLVKARLY